jgi:hypothetical protein
MMKHFWHTANCAFSKEDRQAFNKWKIEMYLAAEKARDAANSLPDDERFADVAKKARAVYDMVCAIPVLEE